MISIKQLSHFNLVLVLLLSGCMSTFEPRLTSIDLSKPGLPGAQEAHAGVEVSVEEFASPDKSHRAFDADIAPRGVLPLLLRIENNGTASYIVRRQQVVVMVNSHPLPPMYAFEAADLGASRNGTWNALVNTTALGPLAMFFWPVTIAGTATQTQKINRQIEHHFESLELTDSVIRPGEKLAGFVFRRMFSLKNWDSATVGITLAQEGDEATGTKPLNFQLKLAVPPPLRSDNTEMSGAAQR